MTEPNTTAPDWALVELMGHRRLAGKISEETIAGAAMIRIDVPAESGTKTQYYSASAIYAITPCTEETARALAESCAPAAVSTYDLPEEFRQRVRAEMKREALPAMVDGTEVPPFTLDCCVSCGEPDCDDPECAGLREGPP